MGAVLEFLLKVTVAYFFPCLTGEPVPSPCSVSRSCLHFSALPYITPAACFSDSPRSEWIVQNNLPTSSEFLLLCSGLLWGHSRLVSVATWWQTLGSPSETVCPLSVRLAATPPPPHSSYGPVYLQLPSQPRSTQEGESAGVWGRGMLTPGGRSGLPSLLSQHPFFTKDFPPAAFQRNPVTVKEQHLLYFNCNKAHSSLSRQ